MRAGHLFNDDFIVDGPAIAGYQPPCVLRNAVETDDVTTIGCQIRHRRWCTRSFTPPFKPAGELADLQMAPLLDAIDLPTSNKTLIPGRIAF